MPFAGILVCIFVGWIWGSKNAAKEISSYGAFSFKLEKVYSFVVKVLAPVVIGMIFLYFTGIMDKLKSVGTMLPNIVLGVIGLLTIILALLHFKTENSNASEV